MNGEVLVFDYPPGSSITQDGDIKKEQSQPDAKNLKKCEFAVNERSKVLVSHDLGRWVW